MNFSNKEADEVSCKGCCIETALRDDQQTEIKKQREQTEC